MLPLSDVARPSVRVHRCPPFDLAQLGGANDTSPSAQAALRHSHVTVDALIGQALLQRYGVSADESVFCDCRGWGVRLCVSAPQSSHFSLTLSSLFDRTLSVSPPHCTSLQSLSEHPPTQHTRPPDDPRPALAQHCSDPLCSLASSFRGSGVPGRVTASPR